MADPGRCLWASAAHFKGPSSLLQLSQFLYSHMPLQLSGEWLRINPSFQLTEGSMSHAAGFFGGRKG